MLLASGFFFFKPPLDEFEDIPLPDEIAGLPLTQMTSGDEAIAEFADLHGRQFPLIAGSIGIYGSRQLTLWVARAESVDSATGMLEAMQIKIAAGNSPFTPLTPLKQDARTIYVLDGMGQNHFYFQSDSLVIWLAADPSLADQSIQQILEVYP